MRASLALILAAALAVPLAAQEAASSRPSALLRVAGDAQGTATALADPALVQRYQATITPDELAGHLYVYASDFLAGRDTGAPGQRFAALYLAGQYRQMGIAPKGRVTETTPYGLRAYTQPFMLERNALRSYTVTATRGGETLLTSTLAPDVDSPVAFVPVGSGSVSDASPAPLLYGGYASSVVEAGLDVMGAVVLIRPGSPENPSDRGITQAAVDALSAAGARAVVVPFAPAASALARMASGALRGGRLTLPEPGASSGAPMLLTGMDVAEQLVGSLDAATVGPTGVMLAIEADQSTEQVETENVLAFIPGSDPVLRDEVVVISAHLDHVGTRDVADSEDGIYNGADDDGSGTVTMLEIAEAFETARRDGHGPRRSILFLHVTGEEKGLLGSRYYADMDPVLPLANTVADLNIDMIGRYDPERGFDTTDYVYIIGADLISQDIADWNAAVNTTTGTDLLLSDRFNSPDDPNQFFRRSDHWNFGKHDIPFIFYFTGTHEDYHQPGDSADKIDYDRMARIGRLIFGTAWEIANRDERPAVSGEGFN